MTIKRKLNIVELYAGTARSAEPFRKWNNAQIALLVDNNPFAMRTYKDNYPDAPYLLADLSTMTPNQIRRASGGAIDILLGCPPCQGFSDAGRRDNLDPRNNHLLIYSKLASALKPLAVAMENVPLAASSELFKEFVANMEAAGYQWTAGILNAALRGSAQSRQRLIFVAVRKDIKTEPVIPKPTHGGKRKYYSYHFHKMIALNEDPCGLLGETPGTRRAKLKLPYNDCVIGSLDAPNIKEAFAGLPKVGSSKADSIQHIRWTHSSAILQRMDSVKEGEQWIGSKEYYSHSYGRLHRYGIARTITTYFSNPGSGRFWHPTENRAITLREAARLQGFPDSFQFNAPYSKSAVLVGNALDSSIANVVESIIRKSIS